MSATSSGRAVQASRADGPRRDDPRVLRTRAAVLEAARALFLRQGFAGTTMDQIAVEAGLTKRTLYNNYDDKRALFLDVVTDIVAFAESFAQELRHDLTADVSAERLDATLRALGRRLAAGIMREEVIALRRLLIGEAKEFPALAADYFDRAPAAVIEALASGFDRLAKSGLLRVSDARGAAAQFAYLVVGEALDRAILTGTLPSRARVAAAVDDGVETFLARYRTARTMKR